jgi:hypothetical protein
MKLTKRERDLLLTLQAIAQKMLNGAGNSRGPKRSATRRSAAEVAQLKKQIRAAREGNVPVKVIAEKLGVTTAYVYQLIH